MPSDAELAQGINAFVADLPSGTELVSLKDARRHLEDSALAEREPQAKPPATHVT